MSQRKIGIVLSYVSQAINILSSLIYTPIMLRLLGQSEYGLYQLVNSVVSNLSLLNFGFSASYIRFYSRIKSNGDKDSLGNLNGMYLAIFLAISFISLVCGFFMVKNIKVIFGNGLTINEYATARVLMVLMVINLSITFPNSVFEAMTSAHESFFFQKVLSIAQSLLNPFITLPLLLMGYGSVAMVVITTVLTMAKFIINIYYCLNKLKERFLFNNFNWMLLKEMGYFTFFIFLNQIIDQINWSVDKFLLGRFSGTLAVAIYGLGAQINTLYLQFSTSISNVFIPKINSMVAGNDNNHELTLLFTKVGRIQFIVLSLILTGFIFFGKPFMIIWGGPEYSQSYYVALLLIIPITVPLIQNLGLEIQRAKNMHQSRSIVYFFIAIGNVFLSIPLIKILGPVGAAIGTAISLFIGNILFMNWYYHNRIGLNMIYFWKSIASILPALILPCCTGLLLNKMFTINNILELGVCIIIYTVVFSVSLFMFGINQEEKQQLLNFKRK